MRPGEAIAVVCRLWLCRAVAHRIQRRRRWRGRRCGRRRLLVVVGYPASLNPRAERRCAAVDDSGVTELRQFAGVAEVHRQDEVFADAVLVLVSRAGTTVLAADLVPVRRDIRRRDPAHLGVVGIATNEKLLGLCAAEMPCDDLDGVVNTTIHLYALLGLLEALPRRQLRLSGVRLPLLTCSYYYVSTHITSEWYYVSGTNHLSTCAEDAVKTIKELRAAAGLTQLELAMQVGVTPSAVYNWERGKNEPSATNLRDIAKALGVPMHEISLDVWDAKSAA